MRFPLRPISDLREDPLQGAFGLAWYERKPSSLTGEEWGKLRVALARGKILAEDYAEWEENVR
jgi:hypothetical protein